MNVGGICTVYGLSIVSTLNFSMSDFNVSTCNCSSSIMRYTRAATCSLFNASNILRYSAMAWSSPFKLSTKIFVGVTLCDTQDVL